MICVLEFIIIKVALILVSTYYILHSDQFITHRNVWPNVSMLLPRAVIPVATLGRVLCGLLGSVDRLGEVPGANVPL